MSRIFLDTNLLVYPHDHGEPVKCARAAQALSDLKDSTALPIVSTQVLQEFYNILTRKLGMPPAEARRELLALDPRHIVQVNRDIILAAADLHGSASLSFWDALIVATAQFADCDELWTEDFQTGRQFGRLRIVNPFAGH